MLVKLNWRSFNPIQSSRSVEARVVGDIGADTEWSGALANVSVVVHTVARAHVMNEESSDPLAEFRRVNVDGTLRLARQAAEAGVQAFRLREFDQGQR